MPRLVWCHGRSILGQGSSVSERACHRGRQAPLVLVESARERNGGVEEERNSPGDITNPNQYQYHTSLRGLAPNMTLPHVRERGRRYPRASSAPGQHGSGVVVNLDINQMEVLDFFPIHSPPLSHLTRLQVHQRPHRLVRSVKTQRYIVRV